MSLQAMPTFGRSATAPLCRLLGNAGSGPARLWPLLDTRSTFVNYAKSMPLSSLASSTQGIGAKDRFIAHRSSFTTSFNGSSNCRRLKDVPVFQNSVSSHRSISCLSAIRVPYSDKTLHKQRGQTLCACVSPLAASVRLRSGGKKSKRPEQDEESDEDSDEEELTEDDYEAPANFKKMRIFLKTLRTDSVVSSALDLSRNRVDEIFFASRLRLNGQKLLKKSKQMSEGDYADVVQERSSDDDSLLVKRVKVVAVGDERTSKDKVAVTVKVWKAPFSVQDKAKSQYK